MAVRMSAESFFSISSRHEVALYIESHKCIFELLLSPAVENEKELNVLSKIPKTLYEVNKSQLQSSMYNVILF